MVCCCDPKVATRNLFGTIDSCVLFSLVFGGFLDLLEQRVLLAVGYVQSETAAQIIRVDTHSGVSLRALQPDIRGSVGVEPKLERDRSAFMRSFKWICVLVTCCHFSVFFLLSIRKRSLLCGRFWFVICPCINCDVEYIGFGNAVFGVFFSGAGAST